MNSNIWIKWAENKYNRLLTLLFALLISLALPENRPTAKVVLLMLFLVAMVLVIRQIKPVRWWLKFYTTLVAVNLILLVLQVGGGLNISEGSQGESLIEFILLIVISLPISLIQKEIFSTQRVTTDTLKGGIALYVLLGVAWALFYMILYDFQPDSFSGIAPGRFQADLLHFSFVTLTTVGYGDIYPVVTVSRIASNFEAIAGVMYPTILISHLVSKYKANYEEPL